MQIQVLNSFKGDDVKDIDTSTEAGRLQTEKLLNELLKSGSAVFLEREIDGETRTYRVTGYDHSTDRLNIQLPIDDYVKDSHKDHVLAEAPLKAGRGKPRSRNVEASIPSSSGRAVSVAPVSGGLDLPPETNPGELTWKAVRWGVNKLCEERGWHHGCPMPSATVNGHRLMVAKGAPLSSITGLLDFALGTSSVHIDTTETINEDALYRVNEWHVPPKRVELYRDSKGMFKMQMPVIHERLKFWLDTMCVRAGAMDWETEITAMRSLQEKITDSQWASYILSGMFPEKSERSGVTYILRKGLPTIAMTEKPRPDGKMQRHFLCSLCLHPMAYFVDTWAGSQPPSDEVMAHLMLIRCDEHFFWKRSGQHPIHDPRAAV